MAWITLVAAHAPLLLPIWPLLGALAAWIASRRGVRAERWCAVAGATLTLLFAGVPAWSGFEPPTVLRWIEWPLTANGSSPASIRIDLAFGVDGISLVPLALMALIGWVVVATADRCQSAEQKSSSLGILISLSLTMGIFAAQDFALFLVLSQFWVWWTFFLVGRQGGAERRTAAHRLMLASSVANAAWGLAGIGMAVCQSWIDAQIRGRSEGLSFLYADLVWSLARRVSGNETALEVWLVFQPWVIACWLVGLWLRWPLFPWGRWWTGLLSEPRAPVAAFCGASALLQTGYAFFRFIVPMLAVSDVGALAWLVTAGELGVLYFGLLAISVSSWRKLCGWLSLSVMSCVWLCSISGSVDASLAGWTLLCVTSLVVAGMCLLSGWQEREVDFDEFDRGTSAPIWSGMAAVSAGLLGAIPCLALISGQFMLNLLELRRRGVPNLILMTGGLLSAFAAARAWLRSGGRPISPPGAFVSSDVRGRGLLISGLLAAALVLGVTPQFWQAPIRPAWERLYDPYAKAASRSTAHAEPKPDAVRIAAQKPSADTSERPAASRFTWLCAPFFWLIGGVGLLVIPRRWLTDRWGSIFALVGLISGLAAECVAGSDQPVWARASFWSLGLIGAVQLTVFSTFRGPRSAMTLGCWLLRISAIGWGAVTHDLVFAGLAWELAELARWMSQLSESSGPPERSTRELARYGISSLSFWLGAGLAIACLRTTDVGALDAALSELVPRSSAGQAIGAAPRWGLAAVILLCSGIGIRCGLLPWSFGRPAAAAERRCGPILLDQWLGQVLGLAMLLHIVSAFGGGYGGPLSIILAIAAAGTALWNGLAVVGEQKGIPVVQAMGAHQFAGAVLILAAASARSAAPTLAMHAEFDRSTWIELLSSGVFCVTVAACGLTALVQWIGEPEYGELYLEQYRGLFVKRRLEAILLAVLLIGLWGWIPLGVFWPNWMGLIGVVMTPLDPGKPIQTHPVLLAAAVMWRGSGLLLLARGAFWMRSLAFDPPSSLPTGSRRRWDLALAAGAVVLSLLLGLLPRIFAPSG